MVQKTDEMKKAKSESVFMEKTDQGTGIGSARGLRRSADQTERVAWILPKGWLRFSRRDGFASLEGL